MQQRAAVPSPCINLCRIDPVSHWCEGCGRTIDEIVRWGGTDDADRAAVLAQLPERLRTMTDHVERK
jgi:uncharacterized protein